MYIQLLQRLLDALSCNVHMKEGSANGSLMMKAGQQGCMLDAACQYAWHVLKDAFMPNQ